MQKTKRLRRLVSSVILSPFTQPLHTPAGTPNTHRPFSPSPTPFFNNQLDHSSICPLASIISGLCCIAIAVQHPDSRGLAAPEAFGKHRLDCRCQSTPNCPQPRGKDQVTSPAGAGFSFFLPVLW
jgi:hypothetical protein